jgi:hypothetical protein
MKDFATNLATFTIAHGHLRRRVVRLCPRT